MEEKRLLPEYVGSYEELKQLFEDFHIDSEKLRFYIDGDYTEPKAFVIYKDDFGEYVVYKMKADGSRALRYKGPDEQYAVNEYYQKFLEEVRKRPAYAKTLLGISNPSRTRVYREKEESVRRKQSDNLAWFFSMVGGFLVSLFLAPFKLVSPLALAVLFAFIFPGILIAYLFKKDKSSILPSKLYCIIAIIVFLAVVVFTRIDYNNKHKNDGYYVTPDYTYYMDGNNVYYYDDDWYYYGLYDDFYDYYDDYEYYDTYTYNDNYSEFNNSYYGSDGYYHDDNDYDYYDSSWDDDDDWGWDDSDSWDSWDSDSTDWDSDW